MPGETRDERTNEIQDLLGMLYFVIEVLRTDESFGDELSTSPLYSRYGRARRNR